MRMNNKLVSVFLLLALLFVPIRAAHAKGLHDGRIVFGDDYTLKAGETLDGDLAVLGGNVTIEKGATVEGSVAVIGGNAILETDASIEGDVAMIGGNIQVEGAIHGNLAAIGGEVSLGEKALVDGDIATMGGDLDKSPGAVITGSVDKNPSPSITVPDPPAVPDVPAVPPVPAVPGIMAPALIRNSQPFGDVLGIFFQALGIGLIATLATLFLQPQLERVGQAVFGQPVIAGSFGLLTVVVGSLALLVLAVTIILIPVSFLGVVTLALAWLFGMIAIGQEVGERFTRAINQTWAPALTTGFGTFLLVVVGGSISALIPCAGILVPFLIGLIGLGATALTVFGTRTYPRVAVPVTLPPAS